MREYILFVLYYQLKPW